MSDAASNPSFYRSTRPDIVADARKAADVIANGGIAILPGDMGYGMVASHGDALLRMFNTKQRGAHKRHAMVGNWDLHHELHVMTPRTKDMVNAITKDFNLPLAVVSEYRPDHPILQSLDDETVGASSVGNTMSLLLNSGKITKELIEITHARNIPVLGSSANLTGTGTKYVVEDIQSEVREIADVIIDYGLTKYHLYRRSATMIDFTTMEVVRIGVGYELISSILKRYFDFELPADPGRDINPSGHLREQVAAIS